MKTRTSIMLALAAVMLTAGLVWFAGRELPPSQATWDDVLAEAKAGGYQIIGTEALAELYRQKPDQLVLIDTRQEWEYRTGHIAGARNFPIEPTGWARWRKAGALQAFLGPDKERMLVFY